jgi:chromosomal replication initiation ATPase DnaA
MIRDKSEEALKFFIMKELSKRQPNYDKISDKIENFKKSFITVDQVFEIACKSNGVALWHLLQGVQSDRVVTARDIATRYMFYCMNMSKPLIASRLGRDRTSILASIRKTDQWVEDADFLFLRAKKRFIKVLEAWAKENGHEDTLLNDLF